MTLWSSLPVVSPLKVEAAASSWRSVLIWSGDRRHLGFLVRGCLQGCIIKSTNNCWTHTWATAPIFSRLLPWQWWVFLLPKYPGSKALQPPLATVVAVFDKCVTKMAIKTFQKDWIWHQHICFNKEKQLSFEHLCRCLRYKSQTRYTALYRHSLELQQLGLNSSEFWGQNKKTVKQKGGKSA